MILTPAAFTRLRSILLRALVGGLFGGTLHPSPAQTPAKASLSESSTIKLNFQNVPVQAIIPLYTQLTGKKIIQDSSLQGEPLRIVAPEPLPIKEAVSFIEATLLLNGYVFIPVDARTVKLIHHSGGKSPTPEGLPVYRNLAELPEGEEICHFILPLQHISPDEASKAFQQVIKLHAYGAIMPMMNSSALIITENTATIRSIAEMARVIDVAPAEIANEMIQLQRSDPESIAEIISEIFDEREKAAESAAAISPTTPAATNPRPTGNTAPANPASSANTNPSIARVQVFPHRRTNSLLVIARPVDIAYIRGLVEKLDQPSDNVTFLKRKLSYIDVGDFLPVAYNALAKDTDIQNETSASSGGGAGGSSRRRPSGSSNSPSTDAANRQNDSGLDNQGFNSAGGFGFNSGNQGQNNRAARSLLDDPEATSAPESIVVGKTLLIADPQSNSLVVNGSPEHIQIIDQLIQEMDVCPQQVYISTIIGQLSLGGEFNYGFDFLNALDDFTLRQKGVTTPSGSTSIAGALDLPFNGDNISTAALGFYGQLGALSRYIKVLEGNKNFKVLSSPSLHIMNNGKAVISSGQRIAVPVNILSNAGFNNVAATSASIDYRDVVLKLEVVPLINSDREVTLRIAQINDNIVGEQNISGNTVPTIGTQELLTTVTVRNGATVVLGGLVTERTGNNERGAIFLRRVPVLKHLFGSTQKTSQRDELLIFIQPNIVSARDPGNHPNEIEARRTRILDETMRFGMPLDEIPKALPADK